jgi:hypothetical protein
MGKIDWFGKHKREVWQQLADQLQGDFIKGKGFKPDRVEAWHGNWMLTIDTWNTDKVVFTRIRAPYVNRDDFIFKIFRKKFGHGLAKKLGMKDIAVGHPYFDQDFIIQGSDERKLKMMFDDPFIRELLSIQKHVYLELRREAPLFTKPRFPDDVNELYYQTSTIIKDLNQLHDLYDLFAETLDHLCEIGTAYEDDPDFRYYN